MIITKAPFRMSFFGGGTDMEEYFKENGGAVISTTIDKYCYISIRKLLHFFDYKTELSYAQIERVNNIDDINHPLIRNTMKMLDIEDIRLTYEADLPARSGLGTSSSFAIAMLLAFHEVKNEHKTKKELADEAIYVERILCKEAGGWQDQIAASYGGFNRIDFNQNGYTVTPIAISPQRKKQLNQNLMMFFTGFTRISSDIQKINNEITLEEKKDSLKKMYEIVNKAEEILVNENISLNEFGILLNETWNLKKKTGKAVSNAKIDELYQRAMNAGALGGKLLGAGSGGFLLFYVEKEKQKQVLEELKELIYIPFSFENDGASLIYKTPKNEVGDL